MARRRNELNPYHLIQLDVAWEDFKRTKVVPERYWDAVTAAYCVYTDSKHKKRANEMYKWIQRELCYARG